MKYVWFIVNTLLVTLALWDGYGSLAPEKLRRTNPDAVLCAILFVGVPLFALGAVGFSVKGCKCERLSRPSWGRNPFNWWFDPLQSLFITSCVMAAMAIGSAVRHPALGTVAFWTFGVYSCSAVGLFIGQILVYRIYRTNIIP